MKTTTMVRIYLAEGSGAVQKVVTHLVDTEKVKGITVFRGIEGVGTSGKVHSANLIDLSLDLPVTIEFFDEMQRVDAIIASLGNLVKPEHIVRWNVELV